MISSERGFFSRLENIDRRWIWLILFALIAYTCIKPIGLPITVGEHATALYRFLDSIPSGSTLLISEDHSMATRPECYPQSYAIAYHATQKNLNIIYSALWVDGAIVADQVLRDVFKIPTDMATDKHPDYGVRFVHIGYIAGGEASVKTMATDLHALIKADNYGRAIKELPLLKNLKGLKDVALIVPLSTGTPGVNQWWQQVRVPYGTPLGCGGSATMVAIVAPLYPTELVGYMGGLRGGAEYEYLLKRPGLGIQGMDAQALAHLCIVIFVLIGNTAYLVGRMRKR